MICPPCRSAGVELSNNNRVSAELLHAGCKDPNTCPCQHRLESVVRQPAKG